MVGSLGGLTRSLHVGVDDGMLWHWVGKHCARRNSEEAVKKISIDLREGEKERGRKRKTGIDLLFCLLMHSWVDSCMCPSQGLNPQPWHMGVML